MLAMEMKASGMYVSRGLSFRQAEVIPYENWAHVSAKILAMKWKQETVINFSKNHGGIIT